MIVSDFLAGKCRTRLLAGGLALVLSAMPALAVTITTARGPVEIAETPRRVVVFDPAALDTLDALGVAPVGVPSKLYVSYLEHLKQGTETVGTLFEPDFEAVAALEPDLIVVGSRSAAQYDALARIAPTIDMTIGDKTLVEDARARLSDYGVLFDKTNAAEALATDLEQHVTAARGAVAGKGDTLIVMTNGPKVSVYGPASRFGWLHATVGIPPAVENVSTETHGDAISFEFIAKTNPDWLLVVDRAAAIGEQAENARQTLDNPLVAGTVAWQRDQVVYLDAASIYVAGGGIRSLVRILDDITTAFSR